MVKVTRDSSWKQFKASWWNIIKGGIIFAIKYPWYINILWTRLSYIWKDFSGPMMTPQGFEIRENNELLVYGQQFIEQSLYHKVYIKALKKSYNPVIIDVGYNIGMFSHWINSFNIGIRIFGFEPYKEYFDEAFRISREAARPLDSKLENIAIGDKTGLAVLKIGQSIGMEAKGVIEEREVRVEPLDNLILPTGEIFLLKIDTDGNNVNVLLGAKEVLRRTRFILIEKEIHDNGGRFNYDEFLPIYQWTKYELKADWLYERKQVSVWPRRFEGYNPSNIKVEGETTLIPATSDVRRDGQ